MGKARHLGLLMILCIPMAIPFDATGLERASPRSLPPVAVISYPENNSSYKSNESILLVSNGSYDPDGRVVSLRWSFGDYTTDQWGCFTHHSYYRGGTYNVSLIVTDDEGLDGVARISLVIIQTIPPVAIISSPQNNSTYGARESVTFDGSRSYDPDGSLSPCTWDFGDGQDDHDLKSTHTYRNEGKYRVFLNLSDNDNCRSSASIVINIRSHSGAVISRPPDNSSFVVGETVAFDGNDSYHTDGTLTAWRWDFGDGSPYAWGPAVEHSYSSDGAYQVSLRVTDSSNQNWTSAITVNIGQNLPPVAVISAPANGSLHLPGARITFDGSASYDPDGQIVDWLWSDLSGADQKHGSVVNYSFAKEGGYVMVLRVADEHGKRGEARVWLNVTPGVNNPPVACIGQPMANSTHQAGEAINFTSSGSYDIDGDPLSFEWDFGDGSTGQGSYASHSFSRGGTFTITLVVADGRQASDSISIEIFIASDNRPPVAVISRPENGSRFAPDATVIFNASGSSDPDGDQLSYQWKWYRHGDRNPPLFLGTGMEVGHNFSGPDNNYSIYLLVEDGRGGTAQEQVDIRIAPGLAPEASIILPASGSVFRPGEDILFQGGGSGELPSHRLAYRWDFGDGGSSGLPLVWHSYSNPGRYRAELSVFEGELAGRSSIWINITGMEGSMPALRFFGKGPGGPANFFAGEAIIFECGRPDPGNTSYFWDFGDGTNSTQARPSHTYARSGRYQVTLTILEKDTPVSFTRMLEVRPVTVAASTEPFPYAAWALVGAGIALVVGIAGFFGATELGVYSLFSFLVFLYTKIRREEVLDNYIRGQIHGYIVANPGDHYNSILKALKLNNGTLAWHIRKLEDEGVVKARTDGIHKRFYPSETAVPEPDGGALTEVQRMILAKVRETPGISQKDIAGLLKVSGSTVNYHIGTLVGQGKVRQRRDGMRVRYFATELAPHDGEKELRNEAG